MPNKTFENGDRIVAKATFVTSLAECTRRYGSNNKSKLLTRKVISVVNKATKGGRNSRHVRARFDLGGGITKVADVNIRSVSSAPVEATKARESLVEDVVDVGEQEAVSEVAAGNNSATAGNNIGTVGMVDGDATTIASIASQTVNSTLHTTQVLLEGISIDNNNTNEPEIVVANAEEEDDDDETMLEDNSFTANETPPVNRNDRGVVAVAHKCEWYNYNNKNNIPVNGKVHKKKWGIRLHSGEVLYQHSDIQHMYSPLDYFMMSFPNEQMELCLLETNKQLREKQKRETTVTELYKLFGIIILITRFETTSRARLWSTVSQNKYIPAVKLGAMTGMPRQRFDDLWSALQWSTQPKDRPQGVLHAEHCWMLVNDMVGIFNQHWEDHFIPSEWICCDESISRWYGLGGYWINVGLPMYVAIDRKPENGCEIQNSACGKSGVMLRLKLVKHAESEEQHTLVGSDNLLHGTSILKYLVMPWAQTGRGVCADLYFASVTTAEVLMELGLRFIGVVKTATRKFPMKHLTSLELTEGRGQSKALVMKKQGVPWIMAIVWVDRDC